MADPPLDAGAVQVSTTEALLEMPTTCVGALGGIGAGVTAAEVVPALVPAPLVAVTVKVYAVPLVRPFTVQVGVTGEPVSEVQVAPPGAAVTK
jgi:hypothetical protein